MPRKDDYKKFFSITTRLTGLNVSFLLKGSVGKADILVTGRSGASDVFLNKEKESICLEAGVELYGSAEQYQTYMSDFRAYIAQAHARLTKKYSATRTGLTKDEVIVDVAAIGRLWHLYGFLEFPYLDKAYELAQQNVDDLMKKNLEEASIFKFEARELMSKYFFKNGVLECLVASLRAQFDYTYVECLYDDEVIALFDGVTVPEQEAKKRLQYFATAIFDGAIVKYDFETAQKINKEFTAVERLSTLVGVTAFRGVARGKAIIVPMMNDHEVIKKIDERMQRGDILIAETTSPDIMMLCKKAGAIATNQGGMLSHAAIVSRELRIPCVIQLGRATEMIDDGDMVEVDADRGIVRKL